MATKTSSKAGKKQADSAKTKPETLSEDEIGDAPADDEEVPSPEKFQDAAGKARPGQAIQDPDFRPLQPIFPILIQSRPLSAAHHLNQDLIAIARRECKEGEFPNSNGIGRKSLGNFFHLKDPAVKEFHAILTRACNDFFKAYLPRVFEKPKIPMQIKMAGWAYVLGQGGQVMPHIHGKGLISGTYYLKLPKSFKQGQKGKGNFVLMNPNAGAYMGTPLGAMDKCSPPIKEGNLILFPSYMPHFVRPFDDDDERIAISFDVNLVPRADLKQGQPQQPAGAGNS